MEGVDFNANNQRWARAVRRANGPDLEETVQLAPNGDDAEEAERRALARTLPVGAAAGHAQWEAQAAEDGADPVAPAPGRRVSRRVLFAAGGLALVGGSGVAAASRLSSSGSSSTASSPLGTGSPRPSPEPSTHAEAVGPTSPDDLSSSSGTASPPPDVANPGSGIDPSKTQSAPEYYVHAGPKVIALTLDDGPHPVYTPQVLALLDRYKITATFCMIGRQVAANHALVSEVAAAGHMIANHTWDHANQSRLALSQIRSEIDRTNEALNSVGVHPTVFRAPYGAWSRTLFEACAGADLRPLDWSVDPRDWSRPGASAIVSRILSNTRTGSIILEHDGGGDRSQTVAALQVVLPQLLASGYRFTTV
jgi:peptidoglycan/xylan/chitin deacetylase (PgdA/CDA1 family)